MTPTHEGRDTGAILGDESDQRNRWASMWNDLRLCGPMDRIPFPYCICLEEIDDESEVRVSQEMGF